MKSETVEVTCMVCGDTIVFSKPLSTVDKERTEKEWFVCVDCD